MSKTTDKDLASRLIKNTFLFETGINLSIMFCLETIIVNLDKFPENFRKKAVDHFQAQLSSNEVVELLTDAVIDEYFDNIGDNPEFLDSILSLFDSPISFELAFFFTVLDPAFRRVIKQRCLELTSRYRGSISERMAEGLISRVLDRGEEQLFVSGEFSFALSNDRKKELEEDFREYLGRYRASSHEEISNQKIRFNMGADGYERPSLPVASAPDAISDWRSFCRYSYISNKFALFPELTAGKTVAQTVQESLFIPRSIHVNRLTDGKQINTFDGIWYLRERLNKIDCKLLNVFGGRGAGLSAFARMLTVNLAMAYSRGTLTVFPVYIDLRGRTSSELGNLTQIIDDEILHGIDDLIFSWSTERTILIFDNFDRVLFEDKTQREKYVNSFLELAKVLRTGGVVLVTDTPLSGTKPGLEIEQVSIDPFSESNIRDWLKTWCSLLEKKIIRTDMINPELMELFAKPLFLWQAVNYSWIEVLRNPLQGRMVFIQNLLDKVMRAGAEYILKGERKSVDPRALSSFLVELAWLSYSKSTHVDAATCEELLARLKLPLTVSDLTRLRLTRVFDIMGKKANDLSFKIASQTVMDFLIARRFISSLRRKDVFGILGRPLSESVFEMVIEMLDLELGMDVEKNAHKVLRDTCWKWFNIPAVAVIPQKIIKNQIVFSDLELFSDFRLFCFLVLTELTRTIGDEMPLNRGSSRALSQLIKSLQSNPYPGRIDFRKYLTNLNLKGVHFEDIDLSGADFSNATLDEATFSRCNLEKANFSNSSLVGSRFNNCLMRSFSAKKADFTGCTVSYCDISGAQLRDANFKASSFINVSFAKCQLIGASMSKSSFNSSSFQEANITGAVFSKSDFQSVDFSHAKIVGTGFTDCKFSFCMFNKAEMTVCSLTGSTISKVLLIDSYAAGITASKSVFKDLNCSNCVFKEGDFKLANLSECQVLKCDFSQSNMTGCDFSRANLTECDFTHVDLQMASLSDAAALKCQGFEQILRSEGLNITGLTGITPRERMFLKRNGAKETIDTSIYK